MYDRSRVPQSRIHLGEISDVNYWTRELAINERLLRLAMACVGSDELRVREFLLQRTFSD